MARSLKSRRWEQMSEHQLRMLHRLGPQGRLRAMDELFASGRLVMFMQTRRKHPDWPDCDIEREVSRQIVTTKLWRERYFR
jgi:hypothetical protein